MQKIFRFIKMLNYRVKIIFLFFAIIFFSFVRPAYAGATDILTTEGNKILLNGSPILLRGVAVGDPHDRVVNYKRDSAADYLIIKNDWQANIVRLSLHPGVFERDWKRGKKILETEVAAARNANLFVIIDWHVIGEPDGWYKPTAAANHNYYSFNTDFDLAKNFWQEMALKYQTDRGVLFELWNEPVNQKDNLAWSQLRPYFSELVELIRNTGSQNMIILSGVSWDYDLRGIKDNPISEENIAYAWHFYGNNFNKNLNWEKALDGLDGLYPVMLTEWGSNDERDFGYSVKSGLNSYNYLETIKNVIIKKDLSYTAWCWHSICEPNMFNKNWQTLSSYGTLVKDFLDFPEKVKDRLLADQAKKQGLENQAKASQKNKAKEFQLRLETYVNNGADYASIKLGKAERQAILNSFISAFGQAPSDENDWQDLIRIGAGFWPSQQSPGAEAKAKEKFIFIFKRQPDMSVNNDRNAVKILAYGVRTRANKRSLKNEQAAINIFKKNYQRPPRSDDDWNAVRAIAYGGVKK